MQKNTNAATLNGKKNASMTTRTLTCCALLAALGVVLARLIIPMPNEFTRFSIEAVPTVLAGILFGPNPAGAALGQGHYGWAIWGGIFLASFPLGWFYQKYRSKRKAR